MSLLAMVKGNGPSGLGYGSTAEDATRDLDLSGKTILVTGCNSGLGKETLRVLTMRGAHVIGAARTQEKAQQACSSVGGKATPVACELSSPESVRACVEEVRSLNTSLDVILCNAGIMALPKLEQKYGFELQFLANHIGHFILVTGLLEQLTTKGRIVMLSSDAHKGAPREGIQFDNLSGEKSYGAWQAYGQSKLANLLFAKELARRLASTSKTSNSVHPGVIRTNLARYMNPLVSVVLGVAGPLFLKTIAQGAATQCYVAARPEIDGVSGEYFADCNVARPSKAGQADALARRLWDVSEEIAAKLS